LLGIRQPSQRLGRALLNRIKIPKTAFVQKRPMQQNQVTKGVYQEGDNLKNGFVKGIVNSPPSGKGNLPLSGITAEQDTYTDFGGRGLQGLA
jgi:hypothetical protein